LSAGSGLDDFTDIFYAFSNDLGVTWSSPVPVTSTPFHNESRNNFGAPQQGDYLSAYSALVAAGHDYWALAPLSEAASTASGADGVNCAAAGIQVAPLRVRPGSIVIADHGCRTDDGVLVAKESADLPIPLENIGRASLAGISGTLSSTTPGVTVEAG